MINIIATIVFILIIAFFAWLIICSYIYRDKSNDDLTGHQSDRQKENNDYNNDYYP
jgi:preprotein translocase subunit SecG